MAPCHGVPDRALSQRQVELTSDEQLEPVFKLLADSGEWQVLHPCRRQFDCQRQAVQLAADLSDKRGGLGLEVQVRPHRLCMLPEQRCGRAALDVFGLRVASR